MRCNRYRGHGRGSRTGRGGLTARRCRRAAAPCSRRQRMTRWLGNERLLDGAIVGEGRAWARCMTRRGDQGVSRHRLRCPIIALDAVMIVMPSARGPAGRPRPPTLAGWTAPQADNPWALHHFPSMSVRMNSYLPRLPNPGVSTCFPCPLRPRVLATDVEAAGAKDRTGRVKSLALGFSKTDRLSMLLPRIGCVAAWPSTERQQAVFRQAADRLLPHQTYSKLFPLKANGQR